MEMIIGSFHLPPINFSSSAGYSADANAGSYNAVKSAVIGISEALALETKPFNVKVIVSPGLFRTNFLGAFPIAQNKIDAYGTEHLVDAMNQFNGQQPGDPDKLVKVLIDIAGKENAPLHLLMGGDAYKRVTKYYESQLENLEQLKLLTLSTNFE